MKITTLNTACGPASNPHLPMWVPGNLPPNLIFLITITPERRPVFQLSDPSDAVAADAAEEAAHLQDVDRREHTVDGQPR